MPTEINWPEIHQEVVRHLQDLIRFNTTNPPGNEMLAAEHIAGVLRQEGIEPIVLEPIPGRGNVIARLKGSGEQPPLLLYGHTDVVGAEPEHWTHPPFSGAIAGGYVWGRGTLDMKGTVAQQLTTFLLLKRQGITLNRDVILAATADEEIGGPDSCGVVWLSEHHPELIRAEFGLTEVGGYSTQMGGKTLFPIQVAEKGVTWIKVRAKGRPGHGSIPHNDNAVVHLARAVDRLASQGLPFHLVDATDGFLKAAAEGIGGPMGAALSDLRNPEEADQILKTVLKDHELGPFFSAMLHNTATPTGLTAGYQTNVIPGIAEATLDGRTLPGFDTEALLTELQAVMGDDLEYQVIMDAPPLETPYDTALFKLMAAKLGEFEPGAVAVPYMMSGATDAKGLARLGIRSYGFSPLKLPAGFQYMELFHAHNERVPIEGLGWGVQVLYEVVKGYCGA
jgi:acetylornithine deacetylase/succinyl-diaminopimelate desuccinylase-like protein